MREAFGMTFDVPHGYLNTASIGIPPAETVDAVTGAVSRWGRGVDQPDDFDAAIATARAAFGALVGVPAERVTIGSTLSPLAGLVAASLPDGASVLVATGDFTSVTFPFAAQHERGITVTEVELSQLPDAAAEHDLVAVSAVQSADGRIVDLAALRDATRGRATRVLLDVTQAAGWLPLELDWADYVAAAGYKWLLAPRGAAWMAVHPDAGPLRSNHANWFAGPDGEDAIYGLPLRLAAGARGLDQSPVWLAQVGAATSMRRLADLDLAEVHRHCAGLADRLRGELGMAPAGSSIVAVPGGDDVVGKITAAGIRCAARAGRARLGFHLYNTDEEVDLVLRALRG